MECTYIMLKVENGQSIYREDEKGKLERADGGGDQMEGGG